MFTIQVYFDLQELSATPLEESYDRVIGYFDELYKTISSKDDDSEEYYDLFQEFMRIFEDATDFYDPNNWASNFLDKKRWINLIPNL